MRVLGASISHGDIYGGRHLKVPASLTWSPYLLFRKNQREYEVYEYMQNQSSLRKVLLKMLGLALTSHIPVPCIMTKLGSNLTRLLLSHICAIPTRVHQVVFIEKRCKWMDTSYFITYRAQREV